MSQTTTERRTAGSKNKAKPYEPGERIVKWLKEKGYELADMNEMPIKKTDESHPDYRDHVKRGVRGHQFGDSVPTSGIVYFEPAKLKQAGNHVQYSVKWDSETGKVYGIPVAFDEKTGIKWKRIIIDGNREINLARPADRMDYFVMIHSDTLKDGVHDPFGNGLLKVNDPMMEATKAVERMKKSRGAEEIIMQMTDEEIGDFAPMFDLSPEHHPTINRHALLLISHKDPKKIIDRYEDADAKIWKVLKTALHYGLVNEVPGNGIMKGNVCLGQTNGEAVEFLKKDPMLFGSIEKEVRNQRISQGEAAIEAKAEEPKPEPKKARSIG